MRRLKTSTLLCALLVCGACASDEAVETAAPPASAPGVVDSAAVALVREFYAMYVPRGYASGLRAVDSVLRERPQLFAPALLTALRRDAAARAAADGVIDGLDFDPFLNSQDPCERYEIGDAAAVGASVHVSVHPACSGRRDGSPTVRVEVIRSADGWQLANWIYGPPADDLMALLARLHP